MNHSFNVEVAKEYGVNQAIFLENLLFWVQRNKANNKHFHDDHYWTYNTQKAFTELFPYWTRQNIRTMIDKLLKDNVIISGNYNDLKYDQTKWYTLTKDFIEKYYPESAIYPIGENQPMEGLKLTNGIVRTNQPIPDINSDINSDINQSVSHEVEQEEKEDRPTDEISFRKKEIEVKDQINFKELTKVYPVEDLQEVIYNIVDMFYSGFVTVNKDKKPQSIIRGILSKLEFDHVDYVLRQYDSVRTSIKRKDSYLKTMIYNSVLEMNASYRNQIRSEE